jgi:hypothetical protein
MRDCDARGGREFLDDASIRFRHFRAVRDGNSVKSPQRPADGADARVGCEEIRSEERVHANLRVAREILMLVPQREVGWHDRDSAGLIGVGRWTLAYAPGISGTARRLGGNSASRVHS